MKYPLRKIYLSNIRRHWPIETQRKLLAAVAAPFETYEDAVKPRHRKSHSSEALTGRKELLRSTNRRNGEEVIYVASLGVLAWTAEDFMACMGAAQARNATLETLETGRRIEPTATTTELAEALRDFLAACKKHQTDAGRQAAAVARRERDAARVALIADDWHRWEIPTPELLMRAGRVPQRRQDCVPMAYRTVVKWLGPRPTARTMRDGQLRRAAQKETQDVQT